MQKITQSSFPERLTQSPNNQQLTTETNKLNTVVNCRDTIDLLFGELGDLTNPTFKAWYCKLFYTIGRQRVLQLASIARADGYDTRKYFSKLLKKEVA